MNDKIFNARDVTKTNTTNVDTFDNPNEGPVGYVNFGDVFFYSSSEKKAYLRKPVFIERY